MRKQELKVRDYDTYQDNMVKTVNCERTLSKVQNKYLKCGTTNPIIHEIDSTPSRRLKHCGKISTIRLNESY